jgi:hypothetical protein
MSAFSWILDAIDHKSNGHCCHYAYGGNRYCELLPPSYWIAVFLGRSLTMPTQALYINQNLSASYPHVAPTILGRLGEANCS